jgi:hypothetical protein
MGPPDICVVLIIDALRERAGAALHSVLAQDSDGRVEVIVVDCAAGRMDPLPAGADPRVTVLAGSVNRTFGGLRADAVRAASAPLIAFLEEHCTACPGWLPALVRAHRQGWKAIGPEIRNGNPQSRVSRVLAQAFWRPWLHPAVSGVVDLLPGHNSAYDRELLLSLGPELDDLMQVDLILQRRLQQLGQRLYLEAGASVEHLNESTLGAAFGSYFHWNRLFGAARAAQPDWPTPRRVARALASPLVPWVRVARWIREAATGHRKQFLMSLGLVPMLLLLHSVAAVGHALGLLWGAGGSHRAFLEHELNLAQRAGPSRTAMRA